MTVAGAYPQARYPKRRWGDPEPSNQTRCDASCLSREVS